MTKNMSGRTIMMSGGSGGIGLAIAVRDAGYGATVALLAKTAEPHPKLAASGWRRCAPPEVPRSATDSAHWATMTCAGWPTPCASRRILEPAPTTAGTAL